MGVDVDERHLRIIRIPLIFPIELPKCIRCLLGNT